MAHTHATPPHPTPPHPTPPGARCICHRHGLRHGVGHGGVRRLARLDGHACNRRDRHHGVDPLRPHSHDPAPGRVRRDASAAGGAPRDAGWGVLGQRNIRHAFLIRASCHVHGRTVNSLPQHSTGEQTAVQHTRTHARAPTHTHTHTHTEPPTQPTRTRTHHTHTHTHIDTHTHTHTHTPHTHTRTHHTHTH
jgi:hypothetical protein